MNTVDHLYHFEDLIAHEDPNFVRKIAYNLVYDLKIAERWWAPASLTIKLDGSPSVLVGTDPVDDKVFVSTKSAFNVNPVVFKTPDEIDARHSDKPHLAKILKVLLQRFDGFGFQHTIQGDVMWDGVSNTADGCMTKINSLTYQINNMADLYSTIGVAWHSVYENGFPLRLSETITFDDIVDWPTDNVLDFFPLVGAPIEVEAAITELEEAVADIRSCEDIKYVAKHWVPLFPDCAGTAGCFAISYTSALLRARDKSLMNYKSAKGRAECLARWKEYLDADMSHDGYEELKKCWFLWNALKQFKEVLLKHYANHYSYSVLSPYTYDAATGTYIPAAHEGLVYRSAVGPVKFVDRDAFTQLNHSSPYSKQSRSNK